MALFNNIGQKKLFAIVLISDQTYFACKRLKSTFILNEMELLLLIKEDIEWSKE